jgi:hypothetical protein
MNGAPGTLEAQLRHRQTIHKRVDYPAHMIGRNQIVQHHRKQRPLTAAFALDIAHR